MWPWQQVRWNETGIVGLSNHFLLYSLVLPTLHSGSFRMGPLGGSWGSFLVELLFHIHSCGCNGLYSKLVLSPESRGRWPAISGHFTLPSWGGPDRKWPLQGGMLKEQERLFSQDWTSADGARTEGRGKLSSSWEASCQGQESGTLS